MALSGICAPSSNIHLPNFLILQNLGTITYSHPTNKPKSHPPSSNVRLTEKLSLSLRRRSILNNLSAIGFLFSLEQPFSRLLFFSKALASQMLQLDRYTDSKEGFTLLVPSSWIKFVADKLILAERRKESTKEAEVISVSARPGHTGLQVYEFEYKVDSTRGGLKRVFSAAFVASKRLYLLNITHLDGLDNPLDVETRTTLEQVMHSFDAIPST
ncbi:psbp domain-containing protein 2 chloroplastic [Phtheirospermum japonicum]|uniref:Psbp domain-containing protein 2 chloroplastic n=1 Tax=Phtheirospermum japonicum TaxID=374723 RepID=A0A830BAV3_9LAMI|nr:psbp domain-containing protein 2 chloroplastic [Phtheirospermum japonicum]